MGDTGVQDIGMYGTVLWGAWGPDNLACFVFNESPRQEPGSKMAFTNLWRSVAAQEEGGGRGSRWYFSAAYFFETCYQLLISGQWCSMFLGWLLVCSVQDINCVCRTLFTLFQPANRSKSWKCTYVWKRVWRNCSPNLVFNSDCLWL